MQSGRRRKHKVIIHTSPFLRCVQTSIAISAGMAEYHSLTDFGVHASNAKAHPMRSAHPLHSGSPHLRAMDHWDAPHLSAIPEPEEDSTEPPQKTSSEQQGITKSKLRVDAFLGEWLSPDYFTEITPPPSSVMMVAGAKADLLRQGEQIEVAQGLHKSSASQGNFPGGWGSGGTGFNGQSRHGDDQGALASLSSLKQSLPRLNRSSSHGSDGNSANRSSQNVPSKAETSSGLTHGVYVPPTPSYAVSPLETIPPGYVPHARDACVEVDYSWDSMRLPQEWGNGGGVGEEWSAMHKRFRRGLQSMISWYRGHDIGKRPEKISEGKAEHQDSNDRDDEETETVLVLVTHGAGCNALIGALTNQPVLLDVGMASLTMAVRKNDSKKTATSSAEPRAPPSRRRSSIDLGISKDYDVKLVASTEHLRAGTVSRSATPSQRSSGVPSLQVSGHRYRSGSAMSSTSTNSSIDGIFEAEPSTGSSGALQRSASAAAHSSNGLWSKPVTNAKPEAILLESQDKFADVRQPAPINPTISENLTENQKMNQDHAELTMSPTGNAESPSAANSGLWGAPPPVLVNEREKGPKRRWTHSEHRM